MITGAVWLDLSTERGWEHSLEDKKDRQAMGMLPSIPDGALVYVDVRGRRFVDIMVAEQLHEHAERLNFLVIADDPRLTNKFVSAARTGEAA